MCWPIFLNMTYCSQHKTSSPSRKCFIHYNIQEKRALHTYMEQNFSIDILGNNNV